MGEAVNIYYLDVDPQKAATYHCDAHLRKMIVEYAQMLCVHHWMSDDQEDIQRAIQGSFFKPTHTTHESTRWVGMNAYTYAYVYTMFEELQLLYIERYKKEHGTIALRDPLQSLPSRLHTSLVEEEDIVAPPPPMCFGKKWRHLRGGVDVEDHFEVVEAYRSYYRAAKGRFATWGGDRKLPGWWLQTVPDKIG